MDHDLFVSAVRSLYGPTVRVYGPYERKSDGRFFIHLKCAEGRTSKLYAKFLLEIKTGRILHRSETVDHIDGDPLNDNIDNLQNWYTSPKIHT